MTLLGFFIVLLGGIFGLILLSVKLLFNASNGMLSLISILSVFSGVQIFFLGLLGEYVGRIYLEVRKRPRYIFTEKNK